MRDAYQLAQRAMADLKAAVYAVLEVSPNDGLTNAEIGRGLGICAGHVEHEGHISRTLLAIMEKEGLSVSSPASRCSISRTLLALMEKEGVVQQSQTTKRWSLRRHARDETAADT